MNNPLLTEAGLPSFSRIRAEHIEPAIDTVLAENRARLKELTRDTAQTFGALVDPIEAMEDRLARTFAPAAHLNAVMNSPELRSAYNKCLPKLSEYATELAQHERLQQAYAEIAEQTALDATQHKLLADALRDFRLAGVDLAPEKKTRFRELRQRLTEAEARFEDNVLDATHGWHTHVAEPTEVAGIPEDALERARARARDEGMSEGWLFGLDFPSFKAVITYAEHRALRREIYEAFVTRASERGPQGGRWDNSPVMADILELRQELAALVGFNTYAEYSLASKMASTPHEVDAFLSDLVRRVQPAAKAELAELEAFAAEHDGPRPLAPWDITFYSERLRQHRFSVSQEELRPYFPAPKVMAGLFAAVKSLYGLSIEPVTDADVWHPDVVLYAIKDEAGELRGRLYVDLYARPGKRNGAWMDDCLNRRRDQAGLQHPAAFLTCNFAPPTAGRPGLLSHDDVVTLFHEFGHCLHHLLSTVDYPSVAGVHGVAWDAVELPSQFNENFAWVFEVLTNCSGHYETGETLPRELFDRLSAARNFQAGLKLLRQLEFALFDLRLHVEKSLAPAERVERLLAAVRDEVRVTPVADFDRFANGFSHIFGGGYAAGYYSYLWAEVMALDAFAAFPPEAPLDPEQGRRFMHSILEPGGSRDMSTLFKTFRGRDPEPGPFLQSHGIG